MSEELPPMPGGLAIGSLLAGYRCEEEIGRGGMAVVYKATRHGPNGFEKTVVIKAMLPALTAQREFVAMFSSEARLMAALAHPNVVQVHDFGVVDGIPYLAMEYLPGRNLSQLRAAIAARGQKMPAWRKAPWEPAWRHYCCRC